MEAVAESGMTVILSSHIVADLERVCDHLVILSTAEVQLAGRDRGHRREPSRADRVRAPIRPRSPASTR